MQRLLVLVAAALLFTPRAAMATCDSNCKGRTTLAGWSADGRRWITIDTAADADVPHQTLVLHPPAADTSWAACPTGEPDCAGMDVPLLPGRAARDARRIDVRTWQPLRRYQLDPVDPFWSAEFQRTMTIRPVGRRRFRGPGKFGNDADGCTAWELRDDRGAVAFLPRFCDSTFSIDIRGGFRRGDQLLVKARIQGSGYYEYEEFIPLRLRERAGAPR